MSKRPLFLLSNDDGVHAPGIGILANVVALFGDVVVVAPHTERSATSHSITILTPLRYERLEENVYAVEGTPADCVLFAYRELLDRKPDWVISGINRGANLGTDTIYSGTVGAAVEGVLQGSRAMAVSCDGQDTKNLNYETAAIIVEKILEKRANICSNFRGLMNINVPSVPIEDIKGIKPAVLGRRNYHPQFMRGTDPRGKDYYWMGGEAEGYEDIPGSDCEYVDQNYATISFLRPSLFDEVGHRQLEQDLAKVFG
ncbi:MAG: 5'/3'-nucleotidase SurE [Bdellovibrionota bacterium]